MEEKELPGWVHVYAFMAKQEMRRKRDALEKDKATPGYKERVAKANKEYSERWARIHKRDE